MFIEELSNITKNTINLEQVDKDTWKVNSDATFLNGTKLVIFLQNKNEKWLLHDDKETIKYMNELYELKSKDVKMCISNIIKIYGFTITSGNLIAELEKPEDFSAKYFDYVMCVGQLANMFAFFDKPQ